MGDRIFGSSCGKHAWSVDLWKLIRRIELPAWGNKNNYKGGVGKWPELRFRVPPELKEALDAVDWRSSNVQALKILKAWKIRIDEETAVPSESSKLAAHRSKSGKSVDKPDTKTAKKKIKKRATSRS